MVCLSRMAESSPRGLMYIRTEESAGLRGKQGSLSDHGEGRDERH